MLTNQEIFDKIALHLLTQRVQAREARKGCRYRVYVSPDLVLKCAVGCVIPDELYSRDMEGRTVVGLLTNFPGLSDLFPHQGLLSRCQAIHDTYAPEYWRNKLELIGEAYGLSIEILDNFPEAV